MRRVVVVAVLVLVLAAAVGTRSQQPARLDETEWTQIVRVLAIEDSFENSQMGLSLSYLSQAASGKEPIQTVGVGVPEHRLLAIRALGRVGRLLAAQVLLPLLKDPDGRIRLEAATAMTFALRASFDPDNPIDLPRKAAIDIAGLWA